jgi:putative lipoic acid-binding regulatory protein
VIDDRTAAKDVQDGLNRLVRLLGGWPSYFGREERKHGFSILAQLRRDRVLDESVFGMAVRYAVHRAAYDKVSSAIRAAEKDDPEEAQKPSSEGGFLSGDEQRRAYHFNRVAQLERELLATPYARVKAGGSAQTSFMDLLEKAPKNLGGNDTVTPFTPMTRTGGRRA